MRFAAGRLRVSLGFSFNASRKSHNEILYDKARAYAERSLSERYPPGSAKRWGVVTVVKNDRWRDSGLLASRTATLLAEREAVLGLISGNPTVRWSGQSVRVPRWRWHKRRMLVRELCKRHSIVKWW